ncbi:DUF2726 domain-containing protein [Ferrimonas pelagia]|uniref:DUF2726 domain-containing protein n=1 Tax=Ferrimonas pelagia TaxID=1177826 RepID=A0ABP9EYI6_9GAMM
MLSPAERSFYGVLQHSVSQLNQGGTQYLLFAKVRIADVLEPDHRKGTKGWLRAFGRISQKHFDFVLCDAKTLAPVLSIELDDKSHRSNKAKARDNLVNDACECAQLPLVRFPAKRGYQRNEVEFALRQALSPSASEQPQLAN